MIKIIRYQEWNRPVEKRIESVLSKSTIRVGVNKNAAYPNGTKVSDVAFKMEFGDGKIPPRPFMRNAILADKVAWKESAKEALREALVGAITKDDAVKYVGETIKEDIVASIDALEKPELAPKTIKAKRRKGRAHPEKPLIDSGLLKNSFGVAVKC